MDSRERVITALNHREPDRVPFDLGATGVTGISAKLYPSLRMALGLSPAAVRISDEMQQLAACDSDFVDHVGVDARGVGRGAWDGLEITDALDGRYYRDDFGITWKMPKDGWYFDMVGHPLELDASERASEVTGGRASRPWISSPASRSRPGQLSRQSVEPSSLARFPPGSWEWPSGHAVSRASTKTLHPILGVRAT